MAGPIFADRVQESSTTTGTGTYTLAGATPGYQGWSVVGNASTGYYMATDNTDWEVGLGTYTSSGTTLARTTILASSNANAAVNWAAGTRTVSLVGPALAFALLGSGNTSGYALIGNGSSAPSYQGFLQSGTGATTRTWNSKASDFVSPFDFGAKFDGSTDDTTAIQNAINTGKPVRCPAGTALVTGLTINASGQAIIGSGSSLTTIKGSGATTNVITVNTGITGAVVSDITIDRSVAATGGFGLGCAGSVEFADFNNLIIKNQSVGLLLGATGWSNASNIISTNNYSHGVYITNSSAVNSSQWQMYNILSQENDGTGFLVISVTGSTALNVGQMTKLASFANSGYGFAALGNASYPIQGLRISDSFFGTDADGEIYLDTYGSTHQIATTYAEIAGTGATGRTLTTPATHLGNGLTVTANNTFVEVTGCVFSGNSQSGANVAATLYNSLSNSFFVVNGTYGITAADGAKTLINGNAFNGNTSGTINITSNASSLHAKGNLPQSINDNGQLLGTATNDNASAGNVGEYVESVIASGSSISLTTATPANLTSISLTAGDWDVDAVFDFIGGATTTVTYLVGSISLTSATIDNTNGRSVATPQQGNAIFNQTPGGINPRSLPPVRFSLATTTTVYAVAQAAFGTSTCTVYGILRARRAR